MSSKHFYTVPFVWNKTVWVVTFAMFGLWIGVSGWLVYEACTEASATEPLTTLLLFNAIIIPVIIACEGYAPQRLEVGESQIVILRRYHSIAIHRDEVKSIERLPDNALRGAMRMGGVGGMFGYFGKYYTRRIGSFSLYATALTNLYLIRKWDGKNIVFSCAEPDKMEHFINN